MSFDKLFDDYVAYQASNKMAKQVLRMLVEDTAAEIPFVRTHTGCRESVRFVRCWQ